MNESNLGTLFFINKSSKVDEVDFAILLKNDRIVFLVIKFITKKTHLNGGFFIFVICIEKK